MASLLELLKQKQKDLGASKRRKTVKPPEGTSRWRILPSWRGVGQQLWHDFGQHFIKNAANEMQAVYICTEKTFGRPCSVCTTIGHGIKHATSDDLVDMLKEAKAAGRVLVNAMGVDSPNPKEVNILELAPGTFEAILSVATEWEEAGQSIFDLATGKDILITRTGSGKLTKYTVALAPKGEVLDASIMKQLHNLDEYVAQESVEAHNRALTSVRVVAGLPAPAGDSTATGASAGTWPAERTSGLPLAAREAASEIVEEAVAPRRAAPPAVEEFEDVPEVAVRPAPAPAPIAAPAPAAAAAVDAAQDEIDDLLAGL